MIDLHEKGNQSVTSIELKPKRQVVKLSDLAENLLSKYSEYENDYVSVEITDPVDLNMSDVNDRLRMKYPYLLDIVRKTDYRRENHEETSEKTKQLSPMELCLDFAGIRSIALMPKNSTCCSRRLMKPGWRNNETNQTGHAIVWILWRQNHHRLYKAQSGTVLDYRRYRSR